MNPAAGLGDTASGLLTIAALLGILALAYVPLGNYLTGVLTPTRHNRVERGVYRVLGVNPQGRQTARNYAVAMLAFSAVSIVVLIVILMTQAFLPFSRGLRRDGRCRWRSTPPSASSPTPTGSPTPESRPWATPRRRSDLTVQNFASAAVGIAVAAALLRGFAARRASDVGNFWVDLVRINLRLLLPLSMVVATLLMVCGVIQNLAPDRLITTIAGGSQTLPGGLVASQEAIKELGTNGGGFFNANSAHPYENPTPVSNLIEIAALLLIPVCLTRTAGTMLGSRKQGTALLAAMAVLWGAALALTTWAEVAAHGAVPAAAGAAMEGKETQFGIWSSALWAVSTTGTSTGAVNGMHDSMTAAGGGVVLVNMLLGEVSPGGVGSGLYGILIAAIVAVFVAGLMVGRTPELLGKKIGAKEMSLVAGYVLASPALVLIGLGVAMALSEHPGRHGQHRRARILRGLLRLRLRRQQQRQRLRRADSHLDVLPAHPGRGHAARPLRADGAGDRPRRAGWPAPTPCPPRAGTLPTHTPLFISLLIGVIVLVSGLTFFPALALGPIAEALS